MRKLCGIASVIILATLVWIVFFGSPLAIRQTEQATLLYLRGYGYSAEDIISIDGYYDRKDNKKYYAKVLFLGEPEGIYTYDLAGNIYRLENIKDE